MAENDGAIVALYWDFENIHAALVDDTYGPDSYRLRRFTAQEPLVDVAAVVQYVASLGTVAINRAYANWVSLRRYRTAFLDNAVELIQLFPPGANAKNGADIRLAIDVVDDQNRFPQITHVVIVGGDSDYMSVAQRCRKAGRVVIGIAVENSANRYWMRACNEFKYYKTLLGKAGSDAVLHELSQESDLREARLLVARAIHRLAVGSEDGFVKKAKLKPMMMRLDSAFDETNYGFSSFSGLMERCADLVELRRGAHDHFYALNEVGRALVEAGGEATGAGGEAGALQAAGESGETGGHEAAEVGGDGVATAGEAQEGAEGEEDGDPADSDAPEEPLPFDAACQSYGEILRSQKIYLPERAPLERVLAQMHAVSRELGRLQTFDDLIDRVTARLAEEEPPIAREMVRRVFGLLYRLKFFDLHKEGDRNLGISLRGGESAEVLLDQLDRLLVRHILRYADPPVNREAICQTVYGEAQCQDPRRQTLLGEALALPA